MDFSLKRPERDCWIWIIEIYEGVKMNPTIEFFRIEDRSSLWDDVLFGEVIGYSDCSDYM
jgi:hypothetical protein